MDRLTAGASVRCRKRAELRSRYVIVSFVDVFYFMRDIRAEERLGHVRLFYFFSVYILLIYRLLSSLGIVRAECSCQDGVEGLIDELGTRVFDV